MNAMPALRSFTLYGCVNEVPACLGDWGLKHLALGFCNQLENLAAIFLRLASLETLHIENLSTLQELPVMGAMTRLTSLTLHCCALKELPCFGGMTALRHLSLQNLHTLTRLPSSMDKLAGLRSLRLVWCRGITELPSIGRLLSLETLHIENCALWELPASIAVLMDLHTLMLASLPRLRVLPTSIGALTALTKLTLCDCALTDVPSVIESLTQLCTLALDMRAAPRQDV